MRLAFTCQITRQSCFQIEKIPWILKIYRYPFQRWHSPRRQAVFGLPSFFAFLLYQKLAFLPNRGSFVYKMPTVRKRIFFNPKNSQFHALYFDAFLNGYEPQTTALINAVTPKNGVFFDIGSNWGWFSLSVAANPRFSGRIYAFEPFHSSYADLVETVRQAGLSEVIKCHNLAVADYCGTAQMHLPDHFSSGLATIDKSAPSEGKGTQVATLDSLSLPCPDVMKVDVEEAEGKVFRGGHELIRKCKPMIVFENVRAFSNAVSALDPILFLESHGYKFYRLAWLKKNGSMSYLIGDEIEETAESSETLALVEFELSERFLLADGGNIFACHVEKLEQLEKVFKKI